MSKDELAKCQEGIGYRFSDPALLKRALTHASAAPTRIVSNERLEFLGDAVLGLIVCQEIFHRDRKMPEGEMTKIKSWVVSRKACAKVAEALRLSEMLTLGKGMGSPARLPTSLLAATFEAIIGAVYLDGGIEPAREFILAQMGDTISAAMASRHQRNYKSLLQQHAQREWNRTPQYVLLDEKGPEHTKCFEIAVRVNGQQYPGAWDSSKKEAEQKAALEALRELDVLKPPRAPSGGAEET